MFCVKILVPNVSKDTPVRIPCKDIIARALRWHTFYMVGLPPSTQCLWCTNYKLTTYWRYVHTSLGDLANVEIKAF
jgi:hypothetical protein